ncbi:hypothetical protein GQR58_016716 [Nymphon striatum]|nr:hypothetical protein GQR58_016716 [Nymphon striatum]
MDKLRCYLQPNHKLHQLKAIILSQVTYKCTANGYFPDNTDCKKYFHCIDGGWGFITYHRTCQQGSSFNPLSRRCEAGAVCNSNGGTETEQERTPDSGTDSSTNTGNSGSTGTVDVTSSGDLLAPTSDGTDKTGTETDVTDIATDEIATDTTQTGTTGAEMETDTTKTGTEIATDTTQTGTTGEKIATDTTQTGTTGVEIETDTTKTGTTGAEIATDTTQTGTAGEEIATDTTQTGTTGVENETDGTDGSSDPSETPATQPTNQPVDPTHSTNTDALPTSTGSSSSGSITCKDAGFFRDPSDCNKFYRCVDWSGERLSYTIFYFVCPVGLVFDDRFYICNWPHTVPSCDGLTNGTDSAGGATTVQPTNPGSSEMTTSGTAGTTVNPSTEFPCPTAGYFRNPKDCSKFYRCVGGWANGAFSLYHFSCPYGLIFDQSKILCNWPREVASPCQSSGTTSLPTSAATVTTMMTSTGGDMSTVQSTTEIPDGSNGGETTTDTTSLPTTEIPDGSNGGETTTDTTSLPTTEIPDGSNGSETTTDTTSLPTTELPDETNGSNNNTNTTSVPTTLPDGLICDDQGFRRYPAKCSMFYQCSNSDEKATVSIFSCSEDLVFDEASQTCTGANETEPCKNVVPCSNVTEPTDMGNTTNLPDDGTGETTTPMADEITTAMADEITTGMPDEITTGMPDEITTGMPDEITTGMPDEITTGMPDEITTGMPDSVDNATMPDDGSENNSTIPEGDGNNENSTTTEETSVVTVGSLFDCPSPGHFEFELDCIRFYRCIKTEELVLKGLLYKCPENYIFDKSLLNVGFCRKEKPEDVCNKTANELTFRIDPHFINSAILATAEFLYD